MGLKDKLRQMLGAQEQQTSSNILHSDRFGDFNLADPRDRKRLKKVVIDLQRESARLSEHDIAQWRYACQLARNYDFPNRQLLYDIYGDVNLDAHLSGTIAQLNDFVKARSFKLVTPEGDTDEEAAKYFDQPWFKDLLDYVLEARYWGHSLIELGDVITDENGRKTFDGVELIDRKHVVPEYGRVTKVRGDDWRSGLLYREKPTSDWLIEVGRKDSLGLFEKAAMHTIPKKYALAFWDTFAEMFGIPIRIAKTSSRDETERTKVANMMEKMGAKAWGVFDETTDIELVESGKSDAFNVYDKRVSRANSELSKLILHQTMTIDDGSSYSQSETHMDVLKNLIESICDSLRDMVNCQLLPRMLKHGFNVKGLRFEWDDPIDYTPEQQVAFETMIVNNYEVPGSYFENKYGVPAGERRNSQPAALNPAKQAENGQGAKLTRQHSFFD